MSKTIFASIIIVLLAIVGIAYYLNSSGGSGPSATTTPSGGGNIFGQNPQGSNTGTGGSTSGQLQPVLTFTDKSGNPVTIPDVTQGAPSFIVGNNTYYRVTQNQVTQGTNAVFDIVYGTDSSISIGLFSEPIGAARTQAEAKLRDLLQMPDSEICKLQVTVAVPNSVNPYFSGSDLGLDFCPGATALPQ